ncbi:unnamed protein product, partial [marine sediment metagenome]
GDFFDDILEFENPKGIIKQESFVLLRKMIKSNKRTLLRIISGEEDLLVLPLVLELPLEKGCKCLVFYGQPPITEAKTPIPEGIVLVDVDSKIQEDVRNLIKIMEKF